MERARDFQRTDQFREEYSLRTVVVHRIARLVQLGIRKSRFFGRRKTTFQLLMAAAVANLTLIANATGPMGTFVCSSFTVMLFFTLLFGLWRQHQTDGGLLAACFCPAQTATRTTSFPENRGFSAGFLESPRFRK